VDPSTKIHISQNVLFLINETKCKNKLSKYLKHNFKLLFLPPILLKVKKNLKYIVQLKNELDFFFVDFN